MIVRYRRDQVMAALFKVCRHDKPKERKMIKAASMDELISAAKNKLQLTNEEYKVMLIPFTSDYFFSKVIQFCSIKFIVTKCRYVNHWFYCISFTYSK